MGEGGLASRQEAVAMPVTTPPAAGKPADLTARLSVGFEQALVPV